MGNIKINLQEMSFYFGRWMELCHNPVEFVLPTVIPLEHNSCRSKRYDISSVTVALRELCCMLCIATRFRYRHLQQMGVHEDIS
jgi:hypothetical protein